MDYKRHMESKTDAQIVEEYEYISTEAGPLARDRAKVMRSPAAEIVICELESQLSAVHKSYSKINVARHANIVQADLANMQGRESIIDGLLSMWKNAEETKKTVDTQARICQEILESRREYAAKRRIGHE